MGFTIYYRSTRPVAAKERAAIEAAASAAIKGRTWLSCEPVKFFSEDDGHLMGGSKPNFTPHPDDAAAAAREGLPDGALGDVMEILCQLSRQHSVDWEILHDFSDGSIGAIRSGVCDGSVLAQIAAFSDFEDLLGEFGDEFGDDPTEPPPLGSDEDEEAEGDDDGGPTIIAFRPKGT